MSQILFPTLRYRDAHAAIAWLEDAFGFERKAVYEGDDGAVQHAELSFRGGLVMLGTAREPGESDPAKVAPPPGHASVYVVVDDPEGNLWSFGTYAPGA